MQLVQHQRDEDAEQAQPRATWSKSVPARHMYWRISALCWARPGPTLGSSVGLGGDSYSLSWFPASFIFTRKSVDPSISCDRISNDSFRLFKSLESWR